jgi:hypothetical protein
VGARHLHRGDADAAGRAVHEHEFGGFGLAALMERAIRGAVGDADGCAFVEADVVRQRVDVYLIDERLLRVRAADRARDVDAIACS